MRLLKYHSPFRKHSSVIYRLGWGFGVFLVSQQNLPDLPHEQIRLAVPSLCSASVECHLRPPSTPSPSPPSPSTPPPPRPITHQHCCWFFFSWRLLIVRKKPTLLKLSCGVIVVVGLFICLIPTIFPEVDPKAEKRKNDAQGVSRVMWPIIFMLGFVSGTQRQKKSDCNSTISIFCYPGEQCEMVWFSLA